MIQRDGFDIELEEVKKSLQRLSEVTSAGDSFYFIGRDVDGPADRIITIGNLIADIDYLLGNDLDVEPN